ncbi:MAG: glycoside hydrolase family 18 protein [Candidatus Delongbacteria bacterium]|nr:glycoside hydrolase family 18 protein [Candidatus Delongbacteria bacterium]
MKMRIKVLSLWILFSLVATAANGGRWVIGYYPEWNYSLYPYDRIDYSQLTHICHAFVHPRSDGSIEYSPGLIVPGLIPTAHANHVKVLISVGGWGYDDAFTALASNEKSRNRFIRELKDFILLYGYDGADIDWEYPDDKDEANCTALFLGLRAAFDQAGITWLTAAVSSRVCHGIDYHVLCDKLDWFGVMTYDYHGAWTSHAGHVAPLYSSPLDSDGSMDQSRRDYTNILPTEKICLGIPFYGYDFTADGLWQANTGSKTPSVPYRKINEYLASGYVRSWDEICRVPYLTNPDGAHIISYDDSLSVRLKSEYIDDHDLAGVIIWAIGFDYDSLTHRQPLLEIVGGRLIQGESNGLNRMKTDHKDKELLPDIPPEPIPVSPNRRPNDFQPDSVIRFQLSTPTRVVIRLFDPAGREVAVILDMLSLPGDYEINLNNYEVPAGIYHYRLQAGDYHETGSVKIQ